MEPTSANTKIGPINILTRMEREMLRGKVAELEMLALENKKSQEGERERLKRESDERIENIRQECQEKVQALEEKNSETIKRVNFLGGRCVKLMIENEKLRTENHKISEELSLIKTCEDGEKAKKFIEEEREKTKEFYEKMLKAQEQLREQQEKSTGDTKPWRLCQICDEEFSEVLEHTPRILCCGHTFCHSCCQRSVKNRGIQCPYCRTFSVIDQDEEQLTINFALLHM